MENRKRKTQDKTENNKTKKTIKKCILQVNTVQQPSHVSLIWKCRLSAQITFLTASTGGIFFLSDTEVSSLLKIKKKKKKKLLQIG